MQQADGDEVEAVEGEVAVARAWAAGEEAACKERQRQDACVSGASRKVRLCAYSWKAQLCPKQCSSGHRAHRRGGGGGERGGGGGA